MQDQKTELDQREEAAKPSTGTAAASSVEPAAGACACAETAAEAASGAAGFVPPAASETGRAVDPALAAGRVQSPEEAAESHVTACPIDQSFPDELPEDPSRRRLLKVAMGVGTVVAIGSVIPLVRSFAPSKTTQSAGGPLKVALDDIPPGHMKTVQWRGEPIWILHRTPEMLATLPKLNPYLADPDSTNRDYTPAFAQNMYRAIQDPWLVCVGICTHLGCIPVARFDVGSSQGMPANWLGGFWCPCHGSTYDLAGRVFKNQPALYNLRVPQYHFADAQHIIIGQGPA